MLILKNLAQDNQPLIFFHDQLSFPARKGSTSNIDLRAKKPIIVLCFKKQEIKHY